MVNVSIRNEQQIELYHNSGTTLRHDSKKADNARKAIKTVNYCTTIPRSTKYETRITHPTPRSHYGRYRSQLVRGDIGKGRAFRSANPDSRRADYSPYGRDAGVRDGRRGNYYGQRDVSAERDNSNKAGATVAGAVVGGLVAGPFGAALGAMAGRAAVKRDDGVGEVAKGAAKVADAAIGKAQ